LRADGIEALGLIPQSSVSEIGILISNTIAVEIKNNLHIKKIEIKYYLYSFFHAFKFVIKKISIGNEFFLKICYAFILYESKI